MKTNRVLENRRALRPDISGENDVLRFPAVLHREPDAGRAEHVTGFNKLSADAGSDFHTLIVVHWLEQTDEIIHILRGVNRLSRFFVGMFAIVTFGIHRLQMRGIPQYQRRERDGRFSREDRPMITRLGEQR